MKKYLIIVIVIILVIFSFVTINKGNKEKYHDSDNNTSLTYEIIEDVNYIEGSKNKNERGYEIIEQDNEYYLIIYYGEVPTSYSKLEVNKVEIDNDKVKVSVNLPSNDGFGDAFSYPKAVIKFDKKPKKVNIKYN